METIDIKIPYIKNKMSSSKEINIVAMLDIAVDKLDQWKHELSKPFTQKDALTLLTYKEEEDQLLLKYGVNRNKWINQEGREKK